MQKMSYEQKKDFLELKLILLKQKKDHGMIREKINPKSRTREPLLKGKDHYS